jgi:hypothetical protein
MRSKNSAAITRAESEHMARVKSLPCSVCGAPGPSEAHHVNQGQHFTTIALCADCHRGSENGWHGRKVMWRIHKLDEWSALNITLQRLEAA